MTEGRIWLLEGCCVEEGCEQEGVVGLQGAWVCLDHFDKRLSAMKAALSPALKAALR